MNSHRSNGHDRRDFLKQLTMGAVGGYLGVRPLHELIAPPIFARQGGASQGRPFEMLVLGDSIMWGQGLKEEQKFSYQVAEWLMATLPGVDVHCHMFAHSGARIAPDAVGDGKPPTHGEVPNHFPSITKQLASAQNAIFPLHPLLDPRSVALVLLDGGINDFGTTVILNPDPTIGRAWVREVTRRKCVARMKELLPKVAAAFPNAKVVMTNYFQIVSEQSDMVYLWELVRFWEIIGSGINAMSAPLRRKMADQSLAFHEASTAGFREAVSEVTQQLLASAKPLPPGNLAIGLDGWQRPPSRVALAEIPFGPEHSYGAPETLLFYLNEPDPAASVRKPMCVSQVPNGSPEFPKCLLAAAGHPNVNGARTYARAITKVLGRYVPEWQTTYAPSTKKQLPQRERDPITPQNAAGRP